MYRNIAVKSTLSLGLALGLFSSLSAYAQTSVDGAIGGTVEDTSNAVVPNATVVVHNNGSNAEQTFAADASGYFRALHLQPGHYTVTITAPGFGAFKSSDVSVQVVLLTDLQSKMAIGSHATTVEVS